MIGQPVTCEHGRDQWECLACANTHIEIKAEIIKDQSQRIEELEGKPLCTPDCSALTSHRDIIVRMLKHTVGKLEKRIEELEADVKEADDMLNDIRQVLAFRDKGK